MVEIFKKNLVEFLSRYSVIRYGKKEILLRPGNKIEKIYFLKSGYIKIFVDYSTEKKITLPNFKFLTDFSLAMAILGRKNKFTIETVTPVEIYEIPLSDLKNVPEIYGQMVEQTITSIVNMVEYNTDLLAGSAYNKVAWIIDFLTNQDEEISLQKDGLGLTHKLMASLTGLTRETVTLQMIRLEKEGAIVNKNKSVMIKNKNKLKKATEVR